LLLSRNGIEDLVKTLDGRRDAGATVAGKSLKDPILALPDARSMLLVMPMYRVPERLATM
jgi:hypothetical protein